MVSLSLIGAASGWGAGARQTQDGPWVLRDLSLAAWLKSAAIDADWVKMIASDRRWHEGGTADTAEIFLLVARHAAALAAAVATEIKRHRCPVILGGDHAIAMGSWAGVSRALDRAPFGLVWFDAHLDAHTPATTPSMNPHGMAAAALLGHGDRRFLDVAGGVLRPEHLVYVGVRSYEAGELELLQRLGVRIFFMDEVRRRGLAAVTQEALALATHGTSAFGLTIDLDGFDPEDAPGVGIKTPDGLRRDEVREAFGGLARHPRLAAVEIVEYIPEFDENLRTAHLVRDILTALFSP